MLSTDFIHINYDNGNMQKVKTWKIKYHVNINPKENARSNSNIRQCRLQLRELPETKENIR